ncbi:MAG: outer membrane protein assembly factor BamE [Methylotenera sp.]
MHYLLKLLFALLFASSALLTGCGSSVPVIKPFKMDIQQGNVVTSKMLLQLRPGMTKSQVRFIMGTPLIVDSFHSNRWDYFYQLRQAGKVVEQRRVILEFEKDLLARVRGDVVPQGTAGAATGTEAGVVTLPKSIEPKPKEKGLLDKLKFWEKDDKTPVTKPIEATPMEVPKVEMPKVEMPNAVAPETPAAGLTEPAQDVPSVLAVPIEIAPPAVETPKAEQPMVEPKKFEPKKLEPVEPPKPAPLPVPEKSSPVAPAQPDAKQDEPNAFRLDKNLDNKNLETAPKDTVPAAADNKAKPKKVEQEPPPPEAEPGYFERMLEKIGF